MLDIPVGDTLRMLRRTGRDERDFGPGFREDYLDVKRRTGNRDEKVVREILNRHVAHGVNNRGMSRHVLSLPHVVDRLDLELLRRQGAYAAPAIAIALGNGAKGLAIRPEGGDATWPWIHGAVRPNRGGRVVHIAPLIAGGIRKIDGAFLVKASLPETIRQSLRKLRGARLRDVVSHPLLDDLDIRVTSAATTGNPDPSTDLLIVRTNLRHDDVHVGELSIEDLLPIRD